MSTEGLVLDQDQVSNLMEVIIGNNARFLYFNESFDRISIQTRETRNFYRSPQSNQDQDDAVSWSRLGSQKSSLRYEVCKQGRKIRPTEQTFRCF